MKGEQMMMTNEKMKINGCTPIEDLITEDFGAIGTPERDEFERGCEAFIICLLYTSPSPRDTR